MFRFLEDHDEDHHLEEEDNHHDDDHDDDTPWAAALGGAVLVQLVTLSGLVVAAFTVFCERRPQKGSFMDRLYHQWVPAFAGGALLATAVFLLVPEGFQLLMAAAAKSSAVHHEEEEEEGEEHHDEDGHEDHDHRWLEEEEHDHADDEDESYIWQFGVALLAGFLLPFLLAAMFPPPDPSNCEECQLHEKLEEQQDTTTGRVTVDMNCEDGDCCHKEHDDSGILWDTEIDADADVHQDNSNKSSNNKKVTTCLDSLDEDAVVEETDTAAQKTKEPVVDAPADVLATTKQPLPPHSKHISLAGSILLGDAFHNFTDGIFIGNAFLLCTRSVAYTIVATTIYHEIAQEVADHFLLIHHCGLSRVMAVALNFASGFSVMLGVVLVLSLDLSEKATGILLAMSAGVYLYIAASECIPRVQPHLIFAADTLVFMMCFMVGAVPIGLVLLNHGHCEHEDH